ncbi:hypothetical protein [Natrinema marinum]|uniref:hypothetical protein n=1 Tax=Natrinema marinum TaxID=2961598 RepID=UPI0020C83885|nr:hypothetical protein [Natrinema marinum]
MTDPYGDDEPDSLEALSRALYRRLAATAERPIDRRTNRWLGEAEAVAEDVARSDLEPAVVRERVETVRSLLSEADTPADDDAREHLEAARRLCDEILSD